MITFYTYQVGLLKEHVLAPGGSANAGDEASAYSGKINGLVAAGMETSPTGIVCTSF